MIPAGPRCSGCLEPIGTDRAVIDMPAHGATFAVHAIGGCRRLLATAADVETLTVVRSRGAIEVAEPRRQPPTLPLAGRSCQQHLDRGGEDIWGSSEMVAAARRVKRASVEREARQACIVCPLLLACTRYAQSLEWAPGTTIAGWTSPGTYGRSRLTFEHPGIGEVLDQARRDRAEARRTRPERRRVSEAQSGAGGREIAEDRAGIAS